MNIDDGNERPSSIIDEKKDKKSVKKGFFQNYEHLMILKAF